jgi:predicted flap endonuclease-1-like 5' DNA nuclease
MYLIGQILILLLLAFVLGFLIAWMLDLCKCRGNAEELANLRDENVRLAAAGAGGAALGAVGGASFNADADRKVASLEAELAEARVNAGKLAEENARLAGRAGGDATASAADDEAKATLEWRNRYLESRVKFLEDQAAAADTGAGAAGLGLAAAGATVAVAARKPAKPKAAKPKAVKTEVPATNEELTRSNLADLSPEALEVEVAAAGAGKKPARARKSANVDDLLLVLGVGPKNNEWLNQQGIYYFRQIASMNASELAWLANNLPTFGSRVYRENWVDQCFRLAKGQAPR